ncbi:MAG: glucokinase [Myxococcota bacterium]
MRILAADIGGTKTLVALYDGSRELRRHRFESAAYPSFSNVAEEFLQGDPIDRIGIGVAGPVNGGIARATNLPWTLDINAIGARFSADAAALVNDFAAVALSLELLQASDLRLLHPGDVDPEGPRVVLGAGTGLGAAVAVGQGPTTRILAGEGGHADFGPVTEDDRSLADFVREREGRVTVEHLLSGPGLRRIYDWVVDTTRAPHSEIAEKRFSAEDAGKVIGELGDSEPACGYAIRTFARIYGSEAGNLALRVLPRGGLFVAGGIAPRLLPALAEHFVPAMVDKAPMRKLLESLRVSVVTNTDAGLLGARNAALLGGAESLSPAERR